MPVPGLGSAPEQRAYEVNAVDCKERDPGQHEQADHEPNLRRPSQALNQVLSNFLCGAPTHIPTVGLYVNNTSESTHLLTELRPAMIVLSTCMLTTINSFDTVAN